MDIHPLAPVYPPTPCTGMLSNYLAQRDYQLKRWYSTEGYILHDDFYDVLGAGAIDNTPPTPGPGPNRRIVDTENHITMTNGVLHFADGRVIPGYGDPEIYYPITKQIGLRGHARFCPQSPTQVFGFSNAIGGAITGGIQWSSATFYAQGPTLMATEVGDTFHECVMVVIIGTNDMFLLVKGAEHNHFELIGIATPAINANCYLILFNRDCAPEVTATSVRIPEDTSWFPGLYASDSFNRADGVMGNTDGIGHIDATGGAGLPWTSQAGTWAISGNKAVCSALSGGLGIVTITTPSADGYFQAPIEMGGGIAGIVLRYVNSDNYIYAYYNGTQAGAIKRVAGVETNLIAPAAKTYVAGATLEVSLRGSMLGLGYNKASVSIVNTAPLLISGAHGLYTTNTGNLFNWFLDFKKGTDNEHVYLERFLNVPDYGTVYFTFDDGTGTDYTIAYPYLNARNIKGTSFIMADYIGDPAFLNTTQMTEMYSDGWDFCNHSFDGIGPLTEPQQEANFLACTTALNGWGYTRASTICKIPAPIADGNTVTALTNLGYIGYSPGYAPPPITNTQLNVTVNTYGGTIDEYKQNVRDLVLRGRGANVVYHSLDTPLKISEFHDMVDWVISQQYYTGSMSDWWNLSI